MIAYYDREGNQLPDDWTQHAKYRDSNLTDHRVARTTVGDAEVSTCWLGLDHRGFRSPVPIIFETMIFGGPHEYELDRYSTEEAALRGHLDVIDRLRAGRPPFAHLDEEAS